MTDARSITVDGTRVAYTDDGSGEPIVLVHGFPQDRQTWRHQIPVLAKTHRVIAIDWPGWGESERPPGSLDYAAEVARLGKILDALAIERCNLFGHDYGGYIALGFAVARPERLHRLAILNSRAHETFPRITWWAAFWTVVLSRIAPWLLVRMPLGGIHRRGLAPDVAAGCFDTALVEHYVAWMDAPEGRRWYARFFADYDMRARREYLAALDQLRIPTAIIWGDADPWCPIKVARELAAAWPTATLTEIPKGVHFVMEHKPGEVTPKLVELLARPLAEAVTAPKLAPPAPARASRIFRDAVIAGWTWVVCAALIALGAIGLFTDQIGPMPTNAAHALLLDLGVGFLGYAFARFEAEREFLIAFALGSVAMGVFGLIPATNDWLYATFHLDTWSSYSQLAGGGLSLIVWLVFGRK